ncbi:MAG: AEC family transporter, partial [Rhodospirillales bacterium]|nr:AEC family transporter [Rhodospirillales bacterium]
MNIAITIILPVFAMVVAGYWAARRGLITQAGVGGLTAFIYYVAMPALLFRSMAQGIPWGTLNPGILYAYYGGCFLVFLAAWAAGRLFPAVTDSERPIMAMGAIYSNLGLIGIPLILMGFGEQGLIPLMMVISIHALILVPIVTILVELTASEAGGNERSGRARWIDPIRSSLRATARNPLIIALIAGEVVALSGITLPRPIDTVTAMLRDAAAPAALFTLGATLAGFRLGERIAEPAIISGLKLVALPFVVWVLADRVFGVPAEHVAIITIG